MGTHTRIIIGTLLCTLTATPALAASPKATVGRVTICHATAAANNPYVTITVSVNSTVLEGHRAHSGDLIPAPSGGCPKPAKVPTPVTTPPPPTSTPQTTPLPPVTTPTPTPPTTPWFTDQCLNIAGKQEKPPTGYMRDARGNCKLVTRLWCKPPPVCGCATTRRFGANHA